MKMNEYKRLLNCNRNGVNFFDVPDSFLENEYNDYHSRAKNHYESSVYQPVSKLEDWAPPPQERHPVMHCSHAKVVGTAKDINPKSVCEIGAGAGVVSKYVHHALPESKLICVEGSQHHIKLMKENFSEDSEIVAPKINVNADIINDIAQDLSLDDNSVELIYTCTVMMHIPFLMIPHCVKEFSRVSSKYVLHVENPNDVINAVHDTQRKQINYLLIDYVKMYDEVGMKHVKSEKFWDNPESPNRCEYVLHLFEKQK